MANFMIRFLICNVLISGIIGFFFMAKFVFKNALSSRMQYNLWFLLLGLLAVPFIPFHLFGFPQIFQWLSSLIRSSSSRSPMSSQGAVNPNPAENAYWINDFALSVNNKASSAVGYLLFGIWIAGIFTMLVFVIKSSLRLRALKKSALPLQNQEVRRLYKHCLDEMKITKDIPVYSTAFLKSPIITGLLKPCIYLPIHIISDYKELEMRYMLLHELQHYKHKDVIPSDLMNLARILYWFNPFIWHAQREMQTDKEVACDASVLSMLKEENYKDYGDTLINFAEKLSFPSFPFVSTLSGNMKQMKRRIINIASYEKPTLRKTRRGIAAFMLTATLLLGTAPFISTYADDTSYYPWKSSSKNISYLDLSSYFGEYKGSFVLYDLEKEIWNIYNMELSTLRVSPNSTYKIYDALFGLEEGIITPEDSFLAWDGESYPFEAWNADQTLPSAMDASVNWYFHSIDEQLGTSTVYNYIHRIKYGNENISSDFPTYWIESSLKISPIEQVELLTKLYKNAFGFSSKNITAVKNAIRLFSSATGSLYGKTGTGRVDGQDLNGWFVGYIETADNTYFFATNIKSDANATGSNAAEITMSILSDMKIWEFP